MTSDEIIRYIMNTPENTNPNILKQMLNEMGSGGSSQVFVVYCDNWRHNNEPVGAIDVPYTDLVAALEANKFCVICFYNGFEGEYAAEILYWGGEELGPMFIYEQKDYCIASSGEIYKLNAEPV